MERPVNHSPPLAGSTHHHHRRPHVRACLAWQGLATGGAGLPPEDPEGLFDSFLLARFFSKASIRLFSFFLFLCQRFLATLGGSWVFGWRLHDDDTTLRNNASARHFCIRGSFTRAWF